MSKRLTNVDGLRGIAAVLVMIGHWSEFVANHAQGTLTQRLLDMALVEYFSAGRTGIVAFFCISGFVIPFSFRGPQPKTAFLISRFFRLYPAYWVSMIVGLVAVPLVTKLVFTPAQIVANATMVPLFLRAIPIIGVYWTLHIEIIFYTLCFLLFAMARLHDARTNFLLMSAWLIGGAIGGAYRFLHPESGLPIGIPTYLAAMHFGTLMRLYLLEKDARAARLWLPASALLVAGVLVTNTMGYIRAHNEIMGWIATDTGYLAGLALFLLCVGRKMFDGPVLAFVGLISYSLYLFHIPVIQFWEYLWPRIGDWHVAAVLGTAFVFGGAAAIAALVQRCVERPAIALARRLERSLGKKENRLGAV